MTEKAFSIPDNYPGRVGPAEIKAATGRPIFTSAIFSYLSLRNSDLLVQEIKRQPSAHACDSKPSLGEPKVRPYGKNILLIANWHDYR